MMAVDLCLTLCIIDIFMEYNIVIVILPEVATSYHFPHEPLIIALARHGDIAITDSCLSPYFFVMCRKRVIRRSKLLSLLSM